MTSARLKIYQKNKHSSNKIKKTTPKTSTY